MPRPAVFALSALLACLLAADAPDRPLAEVNGTAITARDVELFLALRGVRDVPPPLREQALTELIDRELVRQFLESRKTTAEPEELAVAAASAKDSLAARGHDPEATLQALGIDDERFRRAFVLPIAWRKHVRRVVTERQIQDYYETHRRRLDGTRLRVAQIFVPYAEGESAAAAARTAAALEALRRQIADGTLTFAAAAKQHSQSPTAADGGDLGLIGLRGDVPAAVADAAYRLEVGQVSEPAFSPLGGHLVTVTAVEPGEDSLEDARPRILKALSDELWAATVAAGRREAKITRHDAGN